MQFLKHQLLNMRDVTYTSVLADPFGREAILEAITLIKKNTVQKDTKKTSKCLIAFSVSLDRVFIGFSNTERTEDAIEDIHYQEELHLENAIKTYHEGNLADVKHSLTKVSEYLKENRFEPITFAYCVLRMGLGTAGSLKNMHAEIYVSINRNVPLLCEEKECNYFYYKEN